MFQLLRTLFLKDQTAEEDIMYVIAGLGNPDKKYEHTRHNVGFDVIDALAAKYHIDMKEKKHKAGLGRTCGGGKSPSGKAADVYELKRRQYRRDSAVL